MKNKSRTNASSAGSMLRKFWRVIRIPLCVTFIAANSLHAANGYSRQRVTLSVENALIEEVIKEVENQSGYVVVYNNTLLKDAKRVSITVKDKDAVQTLNEALKGSGLHCELVNGFLVIAKNNATKAQQQKPTDRITGRVTDDRKAPLPGVTVRVKGESVGTATDPEGRFQLQVPNLDNVTLVFSYMGMKTKEVKVTSYKPLVVMLEENVIESGEVVVTGIFTRKEEGFTGAVTKVTGDELKKMGSGNVLKSLEMLDPGFKMKTGNIVGSNPNAIPDFQMRGQSSIGNYESEDFVSMRGDYNTRPNQPLFVLDGLIGVSATTIMDIDPERIESITLLKDAAATVIYGSEAANGVVVVETKAPAAGKLRFTYNGNYKLEWPDLSVYNLLNAREKLQLEEIAGYYDSKDDVALIEYHNRIKQDILKGVDTYWLAMPLRTAFHQRHGLTVEGGDQALRYKIYLGANFAPGVMKETGLNTKSGSVDIRYRYKNLLINNTVSVNYSNGDRTSPYGSFSEYTLVNPYYRPYDANGNVVKVLDTHQTSSGSYVDKEGQTTNPLYNSLLNSKDASQSFNVSEVLKVEYTPINSLRLSMDFTLSRDEGTAETFLPAQHTSFDFITDPTQKGSYSWNKSQGYNWRLSLSGNYNKTWGNHLLAAYARITINESSSDMASLTMKGYPNDRMDEIYLGTTYGNISGNESVSRSVGLLGTLNYMYKLRYAIDYSMRVDGSSQFGKNNRYAPFWSVGLRWNADKESFIRKLKLFDELILRATYGITGSQGFNSYQALQMYTYDGMIKTYKSSDVMGTVLYGIGNPNLKWQQTKNYNASLDFSIFKNLINAKIEYYQKYTKNTLLDLTIAPSLGFSTVKENLGEISNKGYELTLRLMPYSDPSKQAYWNIILSGSHNRSRIERISNALKERNEQQLAEANKPYDPNIDLVRPNRHPLPRYENGHSQTIIWAVRSAGIDPQTGRELFYTRDGELTNVYDAADQVPVGDTEPDLAGSVSTSFNYKGFSLTLSGRYTWGGQVFNSTLMDKVENVKIRSNVDKRALTERWKQPGDVVYFKTLNKNEPNDTRASSRFVMNNNEFYLSTINLSYRMEQGRNKWLRKYGLTTATISLYMEDLLRLSTVKMERGMNYPFSRQTSLSLNIGF